MSTCTQYKWSIGQPFRCYLKSTGAWQFRNSCNVYVYTVCLDLLEKKQNIHSKRAKKKGLAGDKYVGNDLWFYWLLALKSIEKVIEIVVLAPNVNDSFEKKSVKKYHKYPAKYCLLNFYWCVEHNRSYFMNDSSSGKECKSSHVYALIKENWF